MESQAWRLDDGAVPAAPRLCLTIAVAVAATLLSSLAVLAAGSAETPVAPQVQEQSVETLPKPLVPWKPGDPVRIAPDLREDAVPLGATIEMQPPEPLKPAVSPAVTPNVSGQNVGSLPKIKPYEIGDPVWIVPDLREGGVED
jgi:hypothetical protein